MAHVRRPAHLGRSARNVVLQSFDNDLNLQLLTRLLEPAHDCATQCVHA